MEYTIDQLKKLMAVDSPSGFTAKAANYICEELTRLGYAPEKTRKGCVLCCLGGEGTPVVFSAHIDTLGGMNPNNAETENAKVYTRDGKVYEGCFQMNDPSTHVNGEYSKQERNWDNMELVLDEKVFTAEETKALGIATGDYVCFVDPDDCVRRDMVRRLTEALLSSGADAAIGRHTFLRNDGKRVPAPALAPGEYTGEEVMRAMFRQLHSEVWGKMYRRPIWDGIVFPEGHVYEAFVPGILATGRCVRCVVCRNTAADTDTTSSPLLLL